ncbi:MAG: SRPBCC family protein [Flavobacteriales bacterium]
MKITIQATVDAPIERVWESYTNPKHIVNWNFAIDTWCCPSAENDLRPGGKYKARMEAKDGSFGFDFEATYDEVIAMKKIVYTIADGRKVVTDFETSGGKCIVTTAFEAETENPAEMQKQGWQAILDNFKKYAESSEAINRS